MIDNRYNEHVVDRKRAKANGEVWTPPEIIDTMCDKISEERWRDPDANFLDPTMGTGNMVVRMIERRIDVGIDPRRAVETTYGVELEQQNVNICRERILDVLRCNGVEITGYILDVLERNYVCSDFFDWDFENWRPKTKEEKQYEKMKKDTVDIRDTAFMEFLV